MKTNAQLISMMIHGSKKGAIQGQVILFPGDDPTVMFPDRGDGKVIVFPK